jgi:transcriptional regulator with XRE-family HTH domain
MHNYTKIDYKLLGKRIRHIRGSESQAEFAKKFFISQTDISRIERGEVRPALDLLYSICIYRNISLYWLLSGSEPMKGPVPEDRFEVYGFYDHDDAGVPLWNTSLGILEENQIETILGLPSGSFSDWWQKNIKTADQQEKIFEGLKPEIAEIVILLHRESPEFLAELLKILKARRSDIDNIRKLR